MDGRHYKDPTANIAIANVKRAAGQRKGEEERLRNYIQQLFRKMRNAGMTRKEMIEMLKSEYRNFINKYSS